MARVTALPLRVWGWVAATLALVLLATVLWRGSDAAATSSTTATPAGTPGGVPAGALDEAWSAPLGGSGDVVVGNRVLTTSATGVRLLDPATGEEAWHYTRANAELCSATAVDDRVVAVFRTGGRCNEVLALDAGTGRRDWYRTIGFRADVELTSTAGIVLAATPTGIATIDPAGNNVRWRYAPPAGCTLADSAAGSTGVAVVQRCPGTETVAVQLFDGFSGAVRWTQEVPDTGSVLLSGADALVGVVAGDALLALSTADGSRLATTALPQGAADDGPLLQTAVGDTALVYAGGSVTAVAAGSGEIRWRLPATGLPVAAPGTGGLLPDVQPAVVVPEADAVVTRDLADGAEIARSTVGGPLPAGSESAVAGPVVVVRSPDGVTGYR